MVGVTVNPNYWKALLGIKFFEVRKYGEKDWNLVSQKLYFMNQNSHKIYRCAKQCRQHWNCYLNPNLKKGPWTK